MEVGNQEEEVKYGQEKGKSGEGRRKRGMKGRREERAEMGKRRERKRRLILESLDTERKIDS